jgi:hypothetical protein
LRPLRGGSPIFVRAVNQSSVKYGEELNIYPPVYGIDRNLDTHTFTDPNKMQQVWSLRFKTPLKLGSDQVTEDVHVPGNKRLLDLPESIRLGCVRLYQKRHFSDEKSGIGVTLRLYGARDVLVWESAELFNGTETQAVIGIDGATASEIHGISVHQQTGAICFAEVELSPWPDCIIVHPLAASPPELLPIGNTVVFFAE